MYVPAQAQRSVPLAPERPVYIPIGAGPCQIAIPEHGIGIVKLSCRWRW